MARVTVHMTSTPSKQYVPETTTINVGDEIVFTSDDGTHNAACTDPACSFDTLPVAPGASSAPVPFTNPSNDPAGFLFACTRFHPTMQGHVIVKATVSPTRAHGEKC
jgi:plastocyanin